MHLDALSAYGIYAKMIWVHRAYALKASKCQWHMQQDFHNFDFCTKHISGRNLIILIIVSKRPWHMRLDDLSAYCVCAKMLETHMEYAQKCTFSSITRQGVDPDKNCTSSITYWDGMEWDKIHLTQDIQLCHATVPFKEGTMWLSYPKTLFLGHYVLLCLLILLRSCLCFWNPYKNQCFGFAKALMGIRIQGCILMRIRILIQGLFLPKNSNQ